MTLTTQRCSAAEQLKLLVDRAISSEPRIANGNCIRSRVACLPLAQQHSVVLSLCSILQNGFEDMTCSAYDHSHHIMVAQLLQLLMADSSNSCWSRTIEQLAGLALKQLSATPPLGDRQLHAQLQQEALPSWLSSRNHHCFGWLDTASRSHDMPMQQALSQSHTAVQPEAAAGSKSAVADAEGLHVDHYEDEPASKRLKLPTKQAEPSGSVDVAMHDEDAADVHELIDQLKELNASCDSSCVHLDLLQEGLSVHEQHLSSRAVQQQLQQLSMNAVQALLNRLLQQSSTAAGSGSSRINPRQSSAGRAESCVLSQEGWQRLLLATVLSRVQQLRNAAPQALLACLTGLAQVQLDSLVSVVLQPLIMSPDLIAVQAQVFVKLMKEVPQVQPRLLELLLQAASVRPARHSMSTSAALVNPVGISNCCWTDSHATLLKALLDISSQVVHIQLDQVIAAVKVAAQQPGLSKSTAFGQMLMALVKQYAAVLTAQQVAGLQAAASATTTFLTKPLTSKLQQLAEKHQQSTAEGAVS